MRFGYWSKDVRSLRGICGGEAHVFRIINMTRENHVDGTPKKTLTRVKLSYIIKNLRATSHIHITRDPNFCVSTRFFPYSVEPGDLLYHRTGRLNSRGLMSRPCSEHRTLDQPLTNPTLNAPQSRLPQPAPIPILKYLLFLSPALRAPVVCVSYDCISRGNPMQCSLHFIFMPLPPSPRVSVSSL